MKLSCSEYSLSQKLPRGNEEHYNHFRPSDRKSKAAPLTERTLGYKVKRVGAHKDGHEMCVTHFDIKIYQDCGHLQLVVMKQLGTSQPSADRCQPSIRFVIGFVN